MGTIFKAASYLFHPIWMPFAGALIYFLITPRFFPLEIVKSKLIAVAIMTLFIPIVFHFLLKTLGKVTSSFLEDVNQRRWPLLFYSFLNIIVIKFVLNVMDYQELYYFFVAILFSTIISLLLVWLKIKISLHMMGLAGVTMFIVFLSVHFELNLVYTISFFLAVLGLTASSRLHCKAHTFTELILGLLVGIIPQIIVLKFWL